MSAVRVLFVDDEQSILDGIRRMLRKDRGSIDAEFAVSPRQALDLIASEHFDVVVSDMRMPDMSGLQLLTEVKATHPSMVRIVLSGHAERSMMLEAVGVAHQYLHKPCDADVLRKAVARSMRLRDRFQDPGLLALVSELGQLPSMPKLYTEIRQALADPDSSLQQVGSIVERDPGISTKILQLVNSSFFGFARDISSSQEAVGLLGTEVVSSVVVAAELCSGARMPAERLDQLWNRSMAVAGAMRKLTPKSGLDRSQDSAHLVGALHLIGRLAVAVSRPQILDVEPDHEVQTLGYSCSDVGGYLLDIWGLPDSVVEAVTFYRNPSQTATNAVNLASLLHVAVGVFEAGPDAEPDVDRSFLEGLQPTPDLDLWVDVCREVMYG